MTDRTAEPLESPWLPGKPHRWPPEPGLRDQLLLAINEELVGHCISRGASREQAEECANIVTLRLLTEHANNTDFSDPDRLKRYITKSAIREYRSVRRAKVYKPLVHDDVPRRVGGVEIELALFQEQFGVPDDVPPEKMFDWLLRQLDDPIHQEILKAIYFEGKTIREIASERGWSPAKTGRVLQLARTILQERYPRDHRGD